jgi:hypothetical protein
MGGYGGMGGMYGGMGGMYGMGGMGGMGMMGRGMMGGGNQAGWFGSSVDSLNTMCRMVDMNSWFFDQIADSAVAAATRLRDLLLYLYRVKQALIDGQYQSPELPFASEEERKEWERKVLRRIYCVGALAVAFTMYTLRRAYGRRQRLAQWNSLFPPQSGYGPYAPYRLPYRSSL